MELADAAHQAKSASFGGLALPWLPHVGRYARLLTRNQQDADDLTQETFLRAYKSWSTFRPGTNCRIWLFTICRNRFLRSQERRRVVVADDPGGEVQAAERMVHDATTRELGHLFDRVALGPALERSMQSIRPEYRRVVVLVDVEDRSYAEAAAILGVPIGTVRSRLSRARRLLQAVLIEHGRDFGFTKEQGQGLRVEGRKTEPPGARSSTLDSRLAGAQNVDRVCA